jgi:hypothetical protein
MFGQVIASEAKQSTLATTASHGLLRFARNDGAEFKCEARNRSIGDQGNPHPDKNPSHAMWGVF